MSSDRNDLMRIDPTGAAHPVGRLASQWQRARQGVYQLMPSPKHIVFMRYVGEDGVRETSEGATCRLAGEVMGPGALCDVVSLVGQAGWRGELVVANATTTRSVFFEHGHVVAGISNAESERIGEVLYRYGVLSRDQVNAAARAVTPELRFGEAAVNLGFVPREQLFNVMGWQAQEVFYAMLLMGDGAFYFLDGFDATKLPAQLNLSVSGLLMEGVRRMDETRYFRERIPNDLYVPVRVPTRDLPADSPNFKVYGQIDGQRSIAEICREVRQGEFEVTHSVFQMLQSGIVSVSPPRPSGPAALVSRFNEALRLLSFAVHAVGKSEEFRTQLAAFATGAGVYDALFMGAGPRDDGGFEADLVVENIGMMVGPGPAGIAMLSQWLYEYASFAVFMAEPSLRGTPAHAGAVSKAGELLAPLAPRT
jgi:hypothetical protein